MTDKQVTGTAREVKGKVEKEVGKATGNERTQAHGAAEEFKGKVEKKVGRAQDKAEAVKDDVKAKVHRATN